jgi:hypothetical protein
MSFPSTSQSATSVVGRRERRGRGRHCRRLLRWALAVTRFALVFAVAVWSTVTVAIACGLGVQSWQAWFGLAIAFTAAVGPMAKDRRGAALAVVAVALLSLWAARRWPDCSWDGVLYHQPAVHALVDGWNPWSDDVAVLADRVPAGLADAVHGYPKAAWMVGAALDVATGDLAAGNMLNWLWLLAPFGPAWFVARRRGRRGWLQGALIAVVCAANPVVVCQLNTSYVDGLVASVSTTFVLAMLAHERHRGRGWLSMGALALLLLVGLKLTGLVYGAILAGTAVLVAVHRRREVLRTAVAGLLALTIGSALAGDSYGRALIEHRNPFHAALSPGRPSVMGNQASAEFLALPRWERIGRALASAPCDDKIELETMPAPRWPFSSWRWRHRYDARFAGFGPLHLEAMLLAMVWWVCGSRRLGGWAIGILVAASATEAGWWARLAPMWWLLPLLPLLGRVASSRCGVWIERCLLAVLLANVAIVGAAALRHAGRLGVEWRNAAAGVGPAPTIEQYRQRPEHAPGIERRLRELRPR